MNTETTRSGVEAFPLYWPESWPRTKYREYSLFKQGFGSARNFLFKQIQMMGGINVIVSSNVPLRNDGLPRANQPNPADPGVAVYFKYRKKDMVFACDKYFTATDNIYAIGKTIEAMRGIERWGASDMMERAFRGFTALPEHATQPWRTVLGFAINVPVTRDDVQLKFRELTKLHHPDMGGDRDKFEAVVQAKNNAMAEIA
jgi:hypothetical protein